ncbi:MAG: heparan-alpha-glucosaminide N-acetyltransferase domain-containing protein [Actinomycetota bacterium]|nr:heparan-alpha-glucosaminide N-acetyltransferase domain-containing protein [Actinomycetota bacterium]
MQGALSRRLASIHTPAFLTSIWARISIPAEERRRLVSVDALRGIAIAGMLLVNNHAGGGTNPLPFVHVDWEGLRFADMVFPWCLFVAGVGMALSMAGRPDRPALKIYTKFASRVVALLAIGLVLNFYKYGDPLRYMGVLQRIALAGALAAPFARKKPVYAVLGAALFLLVHTKLLLSAAPAGVIPGSFGAEDSIAYWVDVRFLGEHLYRGGFEPEGLLGVISSAGQVMLGIAAGRWLIDHPRTSRGALGLAVGGLVTLIAGLVIEPYIPIVKNLWTASYVLTTTGLAALLLAALYYLGDVLRGERLLLPLTPPGKNALAIYVGSSALLVWMKAFEFTPAVGEATNLHVYISTIALNALGPTTGSITYAGLHLLLWYAVAAAMDKSRIYIRL